METGGVEDPRALLFVIAERRAKDAYRALTRRRRREEPVGLVPDIAELADAELEHALANGKSFPQEQYAAFPTSFDRSVRGLEDEPRDAFIVTELRGLTTREAEDVLGTSHMTVHRRAEAARRTVREEIA